MDPFPKCSQNAKCRLSENVVFINDPAAYVKNVCENF